jgi:hypothetical protein
MTASAATPAGPATSDDRLFQAFAEDAVIVPNQWWEGSLEFSSYGSAWNNADITALMLNAAFRPLDRLEVGGRVGFASSSVDGDYDDGSGATDLDVWGKWHFGTKSERTSFVLGALATVPTGDNSAGLGFDAFNLEGFGALRYRMSEAIFGTHFGFRMNGDGEILGSDLDGQVSALFGVAVIFPLSNKVGLIGEMNVESERWDGADSESSVLFGVNWRPMNRGIVRAGVTVGLSDAAPDAQLTVGYAYTF